MGGGFSATGGSPSQASPDSPSDVVRGAIQRINKFQGDLGAIRDGCASLMQQFPGKNKGGQRIAALTEMLQKELAGYMASIVKDSSDAMEQSQNRGFFPG